MIHPVYVIFSCPTATSDARGAGDRLCLHERQRERKREGDSERAMEKAKERGRERKSKADSERARKKANSVYVPSAVRYGQWRERAIYHALLRTLGASLNDTNINKK